MNVLQLEQAVADYLLSVFPAGARQIIKGLIGEGPAPSGPAVLYRLDSFEPSISPRHSTNNTFQTVSSVTPAEFVVTVLGDRAGQSARDDALRLAHALRATQRTLDLFRVAGLMGVSAVRNLAALETGTIRQRAEFRLTLSVNLSTEFDAEVFDAVGVTVNEPAREFDRQIIITGP